VDGLVYFVKPLEVDEPFSNFLTYVQEQEKGLQGASHVKYAQTRKLYTMVEEYYQSLTLAESRK